MRVRSFWSDPIWKGLRIVSFVSVSATLLLLALYLAAGHSWLVAFQSAVLTNVAIMVALVVRTFVLSAKLRHSSKS